MRKIKFRGMLLEDSKSFRTYKKDILIYGGYCQQGSEHFIVAHFNVFKVAFAEQFTGLKDKNGDDIYEGDILKTITGKYMTVEYSTKAGAFFLKSPTELYSYYFSDWAYANECEVVGNIHQNAELLERSTKAEA